MKKRNKSVRKSIFNNSPRSSRRYGLWVNVFVKWVFLHSKDAVVIVLPCDDSICRRHLNERDVVKQNKIKCKKCNEEYGVKGNNFKSNEAISKLIGSQSYLTRK